VLKIAPRELTSSETAGKPEWIGGWGGGLAHD
jgi:hypothetical protein